MSAKKAPPSGSGGFSSSPGPRFGSLELVFPDVWWVWGTVRFAPAVLFPRNMKIVRQRGELILIHPVMLPAAEQAKLEALGPIKHIVRLGAFHGMDDPAYVARYKPTVWAPPDVDLRPGVTVDRPLRPGGEGPLDGGTVFGFARSRTPELALLYPRHGGILFACDSIQSWETTHGCSWLGGLMARAMGFSGRLCIGPGWRKMSEPKDGSGFAPEFAQLLQLDFRHAIGGHGRPIRDTAKEDLRTQVQKIYG